MCADCAGVERRVDVGDVRATVKRKPAVFWRSARVGLPATLTALGQHLEKGRWDAARERSPRALAMQPTQARLHLDEASPAQEARTPVAAGRKWAANGRGLNAASAARMDDGVGRPRLRRLDQAALAVAVRRVTGRCRIRDPDRQTGADPCYLRVETERPLPCLGDSKVVGTTPATFRVVCRWTARNRGNGPGSSPAVADTTIDAIRYVAHAVRAAATEQVAVDSSPRELATRVLSDAYPPRSGWRSRHARLAEVCCPSPWPSLVAPPGARRYAD